MLRQAVLCEHVFILPPKPSIEHRASLKGQSRARILSLRAVLLMCMCCNESSFSLALRLKPILSGLKGLASDA
ncbi:hypothetical protein CBOM_07853 [Ceraceosorus bombacis]|uniref:Uncharacterized protein n=1 Tax=Ceraceosorus bombacis TaxID=401625 RepID=A0A0P1BNV9_9BASI|nr:hypothetical protein CBOM_07853 [Ceraceosorus bombacis]